jgi:hypothetical protein
MTNYDNFHDHYDKWVRKLRVINVSMSELNKTVKNKSIKEYPRASVL